jgi:hypothetical protein
MKELYEFGAELQRFLQDREWEFCFIGGIAAQAWAEARLTRDLDLTLLTGFGREEVFIEPLLAEFRGRLPDSGAFALERRVLLLSGPKAIGVDIALGGLPFEESLVARAVDFEFLPGLTLRICTPEDLIVLKSFAGRPIDWQDVRMTIVRQGDDQLDWAYVLKHLTPLAEVKEQPEILHQLEQLRIEVRRSAGTYPPPG